MTKNKLWQAIKGLTLAAGMAVGIFALGQTDVLADTPVSYTHLTLPTTERV